MKKLLYKIRFLGAAGFCRLLWSKIPFLCRLRNFQIYADELRGRSGLEIGGPSGIFRKGGVLPVYPLVKSLDGCNFSTETIWENKIEPGRTYLYSRSKPKGRRLICEATELKTVADGAYDFVLASHCLEHIANPLKALREWLRVVRDGGIILLVLPQKEKIFDHARPVTGLRHLVKDYNDNVGEGDRTHLAEVLALHDLGLDRRALDRAAFVRRSAHNYKNRCLHHHVYDKKLLVELLQYLELEILAADIAPPGHIIVMGKKIGPDKQ